MELSELVLLRADLRLLGRRKVYGPGSASGYGSLRGGYGTGCACGFGQDFFNGYGSNRGYGVGDGSGRGIGDGWGIGVSHAHAKCNAKGWLWS